MNHGCLYLFRHFGCVAWWSGGTPRLEVQGLKACRQLQASASSAPGLLHLFLHDVILQLLGDLPLEVSTFQVSWTVSWSASAVAVDVEPDHSKMSGM